MLFFQKAFFSISPFTLSLRLDFRASSSPFIFPAFDLNLFWFYNQCPKCWQNCFDLIRIFFEWNRFCLLVLIILGPSPAKTIAFGIQYFTVGPSYGTPMAKSWRSTGVKFNTTITKSFWFYLVANRSMLFPLSYQHQ